MMAIIRDPEVNQPRVPPLKTLPERSGGWFRLSVRPSDEGDEVEYLVLPLDLRVHRVRIYRRHLAKEVEVYDLQVA